MKMPDWSALEDNNVVICGATRRGKTGLLNLLCRAIITKGYDGVTFVDPHGGVREIAEWCANPCHRQLDRPIHVLDPSSSMSFGLNPLEPYDDSWEACHDAANTLAAVVESRFEASPEETPRLARIVYVSAMLCAKHRLTLLDMVELLSIGASDVRASLLKDFDNRIVRRELEDLAVLADKHPREFLSVVESCKNRFVRWLGDGGRLARILGQKKGLNPRAVMDGRNIVLVDLSSLTYSDAAFIGTLITSMYFSAARRRPSLRSARHRLILDEAESLITVDVARMTDQCAKYGLNLVAAVQRLGQLRAKGDFVCDALFTNCAVKICFGGLEFESALYMCQLLHTGFLDLQEWKENSKRPVAVGQRKEIIYSESHSEMRAEHETHAHTSSHSRGEAIGTGFTSSTMSGDFSGSADMSGVVMSPPASAFGPNSPSATAISVPMSLSSGENSSRGSSEQSSESLSNSHVVIESVGEADTYGHGVSVGTSRTTGASECFVTEYQWLETAMWSLEEQLHRHCGELMNLPRRYCVVKIEDQAPFKTRTVDLSPTFNSPLFKDAALPLFLQLASGRSPYLAPAATVDAQIAATLAAIRTPPPLPDVVVAEPINILDAPAAFADNFWQERRQAPPKPRAPKPPAKPKNPGPGRKPIGELPPGADKFTIIDGDADGDNRK